MTKGETQEQDLWKSQDPGQEGGAREAPLASQHPFLHPELPLGHVCPPYHHPIIPSLQKWGQAFESVPECDWMRNPFLMGGSVFMVTVV